MIGEASRRVPLGGLFVIERSGTPALDLGCATGRLLLDYLREGVDIDGEVVESEHHRRSPEGRWLSVSGVSGLA
jgi:hypothetical protein